MNSSVTLKIQEVKQSCWLRALTTLFLAMVSAASWTAISCNAVPVSYRNLILSVSIAGSLCTIGALCWLVKLYRQHTRKVLFLLDAIANNDYTVQFNETEASPENRPIHHALNQGSRMLYHVKS